MKKAKKLFGIITAACMLSIAGTNMPYTNVTAASGLVIDCSDIEKNPQKQFYFSDENEFFIDGIAVYYNNMDVTSNSVIIFDTSPASTYDGKNLDYVVPFYVEYDDMYAYGQLDVKIGMRGDANCDHKVTTNDLILIENDLFQNYHTGKSALTNNDGFGIFLANADGIHKKEASQPFGTNDLNIADALFIKSYLNNSKKSVYENVLQCYSVKPKNGELSISSASGGAGDIVTLYISQKSGNALEAFEFNCGWSNSDLKLADVYSTNSSISVFTAMKNDNLKIWGFGDGNTIKDGDIIALKFKIPENAEPKRSYSVFVQYVDYFGSGINIDEQVELKEGKINVTTKTPNPDTTIIPNYVNINYDYGIRAWDSAVEMGTTSVDIPVMLLGGLKTKELQVTYQCEDPLTISSLSSADMTEHFSDRSVKGIYDKDDYLNVDFETLKINIDKNAKPGKYPIKIKATSYDNNSEITVFDGSVTIKSKPSVLGDANQDGKLSISDASHIAKFISKRQTNELPSCADYNGDGKIAISDAAAIAKYLANRFN